MHASLVTALSAFVEEAGLLKEAKTRQVKEIEKRISAGNIGGAEALAGKLHQHGVMKVTPLGTQVKPLGAGAEGMAHMVVGAADAPTNVAVRKLYNPEGALHVPGMVDRKVMVGQQQNNNPIFAKMYSEKKRMAGNAEYHVGEYIPGKSWAEHVHGILDEPNPHIRNQRAAEANQVARKVDHGVQAAGDKASLIVDDVVKGRDLWGNVQLHPDNVRVTPGGQPKIIDVMPHTQGAMNRAGANVAAAQRAGASPSAVNIAAWQGLGAPNARADHPLFRVPAKGLPPAQAAAAQEALDTAAKKMQAGAAHKAMQQAGAGHVQPAAPAQGRILNMQAAKNAPPPAAGGAWARLKSMGTAAAAHAPPAGSFGRKAMIGAGVGLGLAGAVAGGVGLAHHFGRKRAPTQGV